MRGLSQSISPSLLLAVLALVAAMSGGAIAASKAPKNSVISKSIKKNAVTGAKVRDGSLTGDDIDESTLSTDAPYARKGLAPFSPAALQNGWARVNDQIAEPGYWIDDDGIVHLQGTVGGGTLLTPIFALPAELRPATNHQFTAACAANTGVIEVLKTGVVQAAGLNPNCELSISLDGISLRLDR